DLRRANGRTSIRISLRPRTNSRQNGSRQIQQGSSWPLKRESYRRSRMIKKQSRLTEALLETAEGMHRIGMLDDDEYRTITVRHLGVHALPTAKPISATQIRRMRQRAKVSQAAFA